MEKITVRPATRNDAETIRDFQVAMAMETEQIVLNTGKVTPGVNRVFDEPSKGRYFVAEADGKVVASLLITYEWSDWRNADVWWFQSVYVIPAYRRKGVFRLMYRHIKETALNEGIAGLRLYVETSNTRAHRTYEAMGMDSTHYKMYEWLSV